MVKLKRNAKNSPKLTENLQNLTFVAEKMEHGHFKMGRNGKLKNPKPNY